MNRDQVKEMFKILKNVYPQFEVTSEKVDVWHGFLKSQNSAAVMENTERFVLDSKYPPTIADIKERYREDTSSGILAQIWGWEEYASGK